ncbi:MAG TPA: four helix bundle protein [Candidatus Acidoferrales bacterium]|nr:four helix bundle protein [Candidatus Acidoferrales bacterium]
MTTGYARSFKDLQVYQKARDVSRTVFRLSKTFPKEEMYALTDQFRRSARSIGAQIAEAWGKRRYEKHFVSKLTDADAEQMETQHWAGEAQDCGYLAPDVLSQLNSSLEEIGWMLNSMMAKSDSFCGSLDDVLREDAVEYFITAQTED